MIPSARPVLASLGHVRLLVLQFGFLRFGVGVQFSPAKLPFPVFHSPRRALPLVLAARFYCRSSAQGAVIRVQLRLRAAQHSLLSNTRYSVPSCDLIFWFDCAVSICFLV
jgi:hypothetical protein